LAQNNYGLGDISETCRRTEDENCDDWMEENNYAEDAWIPHAGICHKPSPRTKEDPLNGYCPRFKFNIPD
jgi:hypothetical protein